MTPAVRARRMAVLALVTTTVVTACTDGDDATTATTSACTAPTTSSASATAAAPPATTADAPGSTPAPSTTVVATTLPPPVAVDELSPGLLGAPAVGVPDDWAAVDLDPAVLDDPALSGDIDPFRGLLDCPEGVLRDEGAPWLARRFSAVDAPMDNGLLTVELILELEADADHEADVRRLNECAGGPGVTVSRFDGRFDDPETPAVMGLPYAGLRLQAEPTDATPFPIAYEAIFAHAGEHTVTVVLGGQPAAGDWPVAARRIAAQALVALGS